MGGVKLARVGKQLLDVGEIEGGVLGAVPEFLSESLQRAQPLPSHL